MSGSLSIDLDDNGFFWPDAAGSNNTQVENAVRIGNDTDTVAAIAGTLLGAVWGSSAVPLGWKAAMHGWPGHTETQDLVRIAMLASGGGRGDHDDR